MIEKFTVQQCCVEPTTVAMSILFISFQLVAVPSVDPDVMAASHINAVLTRLAYHAVACLS